MDDLDLFGVTRRDQIDAKMELIADDLSDALIRGDHELWESAKVELARLFEAFFRREISRIRATGGIQ